jgi:hypothetical protein
MFRENLIPITTAACTGAKEQQWDVLTAGKHNNRAGFANVVSTLVCFPSYARMSKIIIDT